MVFGGWGKRALSFAQRVATLEARVAALEDALRKQPGDACPFCGERAMRMKEQSRLLGNQGTQWWEEYWICEKCNKINTQHHKF